MCKQYIGSLDVTRPNNRVEIVAAMRRIRVSEVLLMGPLTLTQVGYYSHPDAEFKFETVPTKVRLFPPPEVCITICSSSSSSSRGWLNCLECKG